MPTSSTFAVAHGGGIFSRKGSLFGGKKQQHQRLQQQQAQLEETPVHDDSASSLAPLTTVTTSTGSTTNNSDSSSTNTSNSSSHRRESSLHSISSSVTDIGATLRRSASIRSSSSHKARSPSGNTISFKLTSPDKRSVSSASGVITPGKPALAVGTAPRNLRSADGNTSDSYNRSPLSAVDPKPPLGMIVTPFNYTQKKEVGTKNMGGATYTAVEHGLISNNLAAPPHSIGGGMMPPTSSGGYNPHMVYQHIHDMASKRISTLDYLRKSHEGRIYWFNTLLFSKQDLSRLSYFDPRKLSRRATNYLILGFSLPTVLDLHTQNAAEYLRALNALLVEFETYQTIHPPDGVTAHSLSRARIPQMFKRATTAAGGKSRRISSAADLGFPDPSSATSATGGSASSLNPPTSSSGGAHTPTTPTPMSMPESDPTLLPGEEYTHLLTPSLPFDPDFYETFATLCDVLIDCYTRLLGLVASPEACVPGIGDLFSKADARVRKVIVAGVVREFEEGCRNGVGGEMRGLGRVALGGLM